MDRCWQLLSGYFFFSKSCLKIWKVLVHILLKPNLENFECSFASVSEVRGGSLEELPSVRDQGQQPRVRGCDSTGAAERSYLYPRPGAAAGRRCLKSKVVVRELESLEELFHIQGREGRL